ncbi:MAG TPA: hypothetical protein VMF30_19110 [Pirellulales bacterium]|nr:hypothetical protein [Pirellulales bacterium]
MSEVVATPQSPAASSTPPLRRTVYWILITLATGGLLGRILAVDSVNVRELEKRLKAEKRTDWQKSRPFLSANDRSRWATARALVEHGTYAIDDVIQEPNWDTIDMVKHVGRDGQEHLYSSKPPLLATILAGPYWLINRLTGATLGDHPYLIGRGMLLLFSVVPLVVLFYVISLFAERFGTTDWGRIFMVCAATGGTFLTTFAVSINNHVIAAASAAIALWAYVCIVHDGRREPWRFALCGFFAAFTAANELPALAFLVLVAVALIVKAPKPTLLAFLPAALLVVAAHFTTNYLAHGDLREPYAHWDDWYFYSFEVHGKTKDSYWKNPQGIDRGEPSVATYALHTLVGHHGIFSLTPIWLLSVVGSGIWFTRRDRRDLALGITVLSLVVYGFYLSQATIHRNYGGMTSGLRWMFWFAPLWLVALLPAADWSSATRLRRGVALLLLGLSVLSVTYPTWNPWTQPWILNLLLDYGWVPAWQ